MTKRGALLRSSRRLRSDQGAKNKPQIKGMMHHNVEIPCINGPHKYAVQQSVLHSTCLVLLYCTTALRTAGFTDVTDETGVLGTT